MASARARSIDSMSSLLLHELHFIDYTGHLYWPSIKADNAGALAGAEAGEVRCFEGWGMTVRLQRRVRLEEM
jgi:hypothetical protein